MSKLKNCNTCNAEIAVSAKICPSCGAKNKKPIYKKWWFYVAIIIILGAIGSSGEKQSSSSVSPTTSTKAQSVNDTSDATTAEKSESNESEIKAGTYKIGTDLEAGEYLFITKSMGYIEVSSDSTGNFDSIIANDNVIGHTYITVEDGQYLKLQGGTAYPVDKAPSIIPTDGLYKDGTYKVGKDIPSGEYKVVLSSSMGYIEVSSGSHGIFDEIISNDNLTGDSYITVEDGQYLTLQGVQIQK